MRLSLRSSQADRRSRMRRLDVVAPAFEMLESRRLLSATLEAGVLTITGTEASDLIALEAGLIAGDVVVANAPGVDAGTLFSGVTAIQINALGGNDRINLAADVLALDGTAMDATIDAGSGNDRVNCGAGDDTILGGDGNDTITDAGGMNNVSAGAGNDRVTLLGIGAQTVDLGDGNDTLVTGDGDDNILGGAGHDKITAGHGHNIIDAGDGHNRITTGDGDDQITAGSGHDHVKAGNGNNTVNVGDGNNRVYTGTGDDTVTTGKNNDHVSDAGGALNTVSTAEGNDRVVMKTGTNTVDLGKGNDSFTGGDGNDTVTGGDGNDAINGGAGANTLIGGAGRDTIRSIAGDIVTDDNPSNNRINETEPNNTVDAANALAVGAGGKVKVAGETSDADPDLFAFTTSVAGELEVEVGKSDYNNVVVTLELADGTVVETFGAGTGVRKIKLDVEAGVSYIVRVVGASPALTDYELEVELAVDD